MYALKEKINGDFMSIIENDLLDLIANENIDISTLIKILFINYMKKKKKNNLYSKDDFIPQNLIKLYYGVGSPFDFGVFVDNFKKKYICNENVFENVRKKQEREGLEVVYDYIRGDNWLNIDNIYIICKIHQLLYSKVSSLGFGGTFRNTNSFVTNGDYNIAIDYNLITQEISKLFSEYSSLVQMANEINKNNDVDMLIEYIDKCVDLKCSLIRIHPFADGNGRTSRALLNIFFKRVNLPPTYVTMAEKSEYIDAMDKAVRRDEPTSIRKFYYYKICDSIIELDIKNRMISEDLGSKHKQNK